MENQKINLGNVILKILELLIIKLFTIPFKVYKNALVALSNANADDSEEKNLSADFPLYVWIVSIFNAVIALTYPIGLLIALYYGYNEGAGRFFASIVMLYFSPLYLGFIKELLLITLKTLLYLKIISKK
jgi:hypothetical protein